MNDEVVELSPSVSVPRGDDARRSLAEDGWFVADLLDLDTIERLRSMYDDLDVPVDVGRFVSTIDVSDSRSAQISRSLCSELANLEAELSGEFTPFLGAFIAKGARRGEPMEFHQDWTYTDERVHRCVFVWVPLVDVDESNGAMSLVSGSHRWTDGIRPSGNDAAPPTDRFLAEFGVMATSVAMKAGEVLFYDPAIVHGTPPNSGPATRPVAAVAFAPSDAVLVHFRLLEDGSVRGVQVGAEQRYMDAFHGPVDAFETLEPWSRAVSEEDFLTHVDNKPDLRSAPKSSPMPVRGVRRWFGRR